MRGECFSSEHRHWSEREHRPCINAHHIGKVRRWPHVAVLEGEGHDRCRGCGRLKHLQENGGELWNLGQQNGRCTVTYLPQVVDAHDDHYQHLQRCVIAARAGLQKLSSRLVGGRAGVRRRAWRWMEEAKRGVSGWRAMLISNAWTYHVWQPLNLDLGLQSRGPSICRPSACRAFFSRRRRQLHTKNGSRSRWKIDGPNVRNLQSLG